MTRRAENRLLAAQGRRRCKICDRVKKLASFPDERRNWSGKSGRCRACERLRLRENYRANAERYSARARELYTPGKDSVRGKLFRASKRGRALRRATKAQRRARQLCATPFWANFEKIKQIYAQCPKGMHVDHIIPLKGKNVCGLHVDYNLQYLPARENISKGNRLAVKVG